MTSDTLSKTIEKITFSDVFLKKLDCDQDSLFLLKSSQTQPSLINQQKHAISGCATVGFEDDTILFRVAMSFGLRLVLKEDTTKVVAQIESDLVAEFFLSEDVPENLLMEFANEKANIYVWPYWVEMLNVQLTKMRFPTLVLPRQPPKPTGRVK